MPSGPPDLPAHFSVRRWLYFATSENENESKASPPCIILSLERGGSKVEDQVFLMKASTIQQPKLRLASRQGCNFTWCDRVTQRESLNYFFMEWGNILRLKQSISIIYKNNSDIGHPWTETWHLCWINAQALLLTSASSSHPWVSLVFYAQKGNPRLPVVMEEAWAHTCTLNYSSLMGCAEGLTHANKTCLLIAALPAYFLHTFVVGVSKVPRNCTQRNCRAT